MRAYHRSRASTGGEVAAGWPRPARMAARPHTPLWRPPPRLLACAPTHPRPAPCGPPAAASDAPENAAQPIGPALLSSAARHRRPPWASRPVQRGCLSTLLSAFRPQHRSAQFLPAKKDAGRPSCGVGDEGRLPRALARARNGGVSHGSRPTLYRPGPGPMAARYSWLAPRESRRSSRPPGILEKSISPPWPSRILSSSCARSEAPTAPTAWPIKFRSAASDMRLPAERWQVAPDARRARTRPNGRPSLDGAAGPIVMPIVICASASHRESRTSRTSIAIYIALKRGTLHPDPLHFHSVHVQAPKRALWVRHVDHGKGPRRPCCKNAAVSKWSVWILHLLCTKIGLNHGD